MTWGTPVEVERRNRIRLSVAAYAYEFEDAPVMDDGAFDDLAAAICPSVTTGDVVLDEFWFRQFSCGTGMWIRAHPMLDGIRRLYVEHYRPCG